MVGHDDEVHVLARIVSMRLQSFPTWSIFSVACDTSIKHPDLAQDLIPEYCGQAEVSCGHPLPKSNTFTLLFCVYPTRLAPRVRPPRLYRYPFSKIRQYFTPSPQ